MGVFCTYTSSGRACNRQIKLVFDCLFAGRMIKFYRTVQRFCVQGSEVMCKSEYRMSNHEYPPAMHSAMG